VQSAAIPIIPAQAAWDCLQSVPLNKTAALDLLKSVRPFVRWQSTLTNLANPPAEYYKIQGAYDPINALSNIEDNGAHDGHFYYNPDIVGGVFNWGRPLPLVSVSEDGERIPAPFVYSDILAASHSNASFTPSALSKINGQDAMDFLVNLSQLGSLQDRDAL
jgi:hypothetical protein